MPNTTMPTATSASPATAQGSGAHSSVHDVPPATLVQTVPVLHLERRAPAEAAALVASRLDAVTGGVRADGPA